MRNNMVWMSWVSYSTVAIALLVASTRCLCNMLVHIFVFADDFIDDGMPVSSSKSGVYTEP